jgi:hypothetical protein
MRGQIQALFVGAVLAMAPLQVAADGWRRYDNKRFAYTIEIPPGFSSVSEADNDDGGVSDGDDGKAELRVWGTHLVDRDFAADIADRVGSAAADGWAISYNRRTANDASWSGSRAGRVFYARAMKGCGDAAIYFRLEYDRWELKRYDAIVGRLARSLHDTC